MTNLICRNHIIKDLYVRLFNHDNPSNNVFYFIQKCFDIQKLNLYFVKKKNSEVFFRFLGLKYLINYHHFLPKQLLLLRGGDEVISDEGKSGGLT